MKRFYKTVSVEPAGESWGVALDGRPVRTPAREALAVPTRALAEAIAAEWQAQGETIDPLAMPMVQLANTALDRVPARRADVIGEIAGYAETDLVCYRSPEPRALAERQARHWQPLVDWVRGRFDAELAVVNGVVPAPQSAQAVARIAAVVAAREDFGLAGLHLATGACGSVVIALALAEGEIDAEAAAAAAQLEEIWQLETWGEDAEARARLDLVRRDIEAAADFMRLLSC